MKKKHAIGAMSRTIIELFATQGVFAILFGLVAIFWPDTTIKIFAMLFGAFALLWGVILTVQSLAGIGRLSLWWLELLFGIGGIALGTYLLKNPEVTMQGIILVIGISFILRGIIDFSQAMFSREYLVRQNPWVYAINSFVALLAGVIIVLFPWSSAVAFTWVVGAYAIFMGIMLFVMTYKYEKMLNR